MGNPAENQDIDNNVDNNEGVDGSQQHDDQNIDQDSGEINFLDLPDDEVDDYFEKYLQEQNEKNDQSSGEDDNDEKEVPEKDDYSGEEDGDHVDNDDQNIDQDGEGESDKDNHSDGDQGENADQEDGEKSDSDVDESTKDGEGNKDADSNDGIDYKAAYEKLISPFKANGRDIKVDSVDDAITLMQMGANYNHKMRVLKPSLKMVKMLEQNDLLDESKLSVLIDINKGNKDALSQFLKDKAINPIDLNTDADSTYSPTDYSVNDQEIELDNVLDSLRGNESFSKTIDIVSNQWDAQSKKIIFDQPNIITVIDSHIQSGFFDKIMARMETEKMLGKLQGVPDIVAYKQIGDALDKAGLLSDTNPKQGRQSGESENQGQKTFRGNRQRNAQRRAAGSTKKTVSKKTEPKDINPLAMSDEEFEKASAQGVYR